MRKGCEGSSCHLLLFYFATKNSKRMQCFLCKIETTGLKEDGVGRNGGGECEVMQSIRDS